MNELNNNKKVKHRVKHSQYRSDMRKQNQLELNQARQSNIESVIIKQIPKSSRGIQNPTGSFIICHT